MLPPRIHLGGTSKLELERHAETAMDALREAAKQIRNISPHARDYIVQKNPHAYDSAQESYMLMRGKVEAVLSEVEALYLAIHDGGQSDAIV